MKTGGRMSRSLVLAAAVAVLGASQVARAQEVNLSRLDDEPANRVHLRTGAEHGFVAGVGYARTVSLLEHRLLVLGDVSLPWAGLDVADYRVRTGVLVPFAATRRWRLAGTLAPTVRGTSNVAARMTSLGADAGVQGGFYARHWFVAAEVGLDWAATTHVANTASYRQIVYADARDGWYALSGGTYRYGLQAGASFGRYDLALRVGKLGELGGGQPMLPFYGTLAVDARW